MSSGPFDHEAILPSMLPDDDPGRALVDAWRDRDTYRVALLLVRSKLDYDTPEAVQDYIDRVLENRVLENEP